jgi:NAD(P)-dependent dehydrogenase (short-subunit alcohol dehydrogenase family)
MLRLESIKGKSSLPRLAIVTGAGGGIGAALATQLAAAGTALVLVDNNPDALARVAGRCSDLGVPVSSWEVDVADHDAVVDGARRVVADDGPPDALFNVAGLIHHGLLVDSDFADIQRIVQVDLLGTISCCQAFLPTLATHARARIVNVSSAFGLVGVAGYSAYNAAKFAVRGFTESLQQEAPTTVSVSCAYPGGVRTDVMRNGLYATTADRAGIVERFDDVIARTSPEVAAAAILRGSSGGRRRIIVGADAQVADALSRIAGSRYQVLTRRLGARRT